MLKIGAVALLAFAAQVACDDGRVLEFPVARDKRMNTLSEDEVAAMCEPLLPLTERAVESQCRRQQGP